jgi:hypothetical protein
MHGLDSCKCQLSGEKRCSGKLITSAVQQRYCVCRPEFSSTAHNMSARALIRAIRCQDIDAVRHVLACDELNVNAEVQVEGYNFLPQETPTYPSTALLEACRTGNFEIARLVLQHPAADVNQRTVSAPGNIKRPQSSSSE